MLRRRLDAHTRWYFIGLGVTAAVIPAVVPALATAMAVPVQSLLPAVPALFLGLLVGVLSSPVMATRVAVTTVLRCGAAAQVAGLMVAALAPAPIWFTSGALIAGAGFGMVESAGTAVTRMLNDANTPRRLTALTVLVGAAATVTPVVVLMLDGIGLVRLAPVAAAAVHAITLVISRGAVTGLQPYEGSSPRAAGPPGVIRPVVLLAAALFCYVGGESVLSGWSAVAVTQTLGAGPAVAALGTSAFWLLITSGRLLGTAISTRMPPFTAARLCCLVATAALTLSVVMDGSTPVTLCLIGIAVVACGPCYGLILGTVVAAIAKHAAVSSSSVLVAVGASGGAVIPLLAVVTTGEPRLAASVALGAALLMLVLARGIGRSSTVGTASR